MKILKWAAVLLLVVLPLAEISGRFIVLRTDAYQTLANFVKTSSEIRERVGDRPSLRLHFFGYSVRVSGPGGSAEFSASVEGSNGSGELYAKLVKRGDWQIESVSLNGQQIQTATIKRSFLGSGQSEDFHQK
ncbi:cytochrome c oxidase assembly factor Coa1 family protein [Variovorax paradoxus]|uniref:cytochrome c oxidase assembly factor Coa1 family protein n=1 Tax=Variovorax paradoxus TaxID=34073 RepID=UPI0028611B52|nr:cytochrome c oxidase assembly factor Coa1 family protein [Variovorax paradoxus]MDR6453876.1 hypothetical protein [Variovorax paradoxus]